LQNCGNMVIVKNTRVFIPFIALIIIIGLIFTLAVFKALFKADLGNNSTTTPGTNEQSSAVSDSKIFFQGNLTTLPNAPQKTVISPKNNQGLSVYWIKASSEDGNDTCNLYDSDTKQIYASRYQTNGQFSGRSAGSMYYINSKIDQPKALTLLNDTCFIN